MEYMMLVCGTPSESVEPRLVAETTAWVQEMTARGVRKLGSRLRPASSATTLRHSAIIRQSGWRVLRRSPPGPSWLGPGPRAAAVAGLTEVKDAVTDAFRSTTLAAFPPTTCCRRPAPTW